MHFTVADPTLLQSHLDVAMVSIDRLSALACLLAAEDVAAAFAGLSLPDQVAIFGAFEADLNHARGALLRAVQSERGPHTPVSGT
ncbi:hypothetical protein [Trinickia sp. EG282A]|uniref:hypothetical protein n=1 Tax=Trinickia sp. EG282A TaxID=3237013 RepID=UPI0034D2359F